MIIVDEKEGHETLLRAAYSAFPTGVAAICADSDTGPIGMAVSSFTPVSIAPPLLSICVQNSSTTWPKLKDQPRVGVSVLSEGQVHAGRQLAQKVGDRFAGSEWHSNTDGAVFVTGASAWFDCSLLREIPAGDHHVVLLQIHSLRSQPEVPPLVFHASRFRKLHEAELTIGV